MIGSAERPFRPFFANTISKILRKSARLKAWVADGANPNARTHVMMRCSCDVTSVSVVGVGPVEIVAATRPSL